MAHKSDTEIIQHTHNTARFFVEHRQVALVLLLGTFLWGWYGYSKMPKRKDPVIPVRVAVASCKWMGATRRGSGAAHHPSDRAGHGAEPGSEAAQRL
jgi:hypothetical protein